MSKATAKLKGVVKNIKRQEGFAFLTHEATGDDYFMHRTAVEMTSAKGWGEMEEGDRVAFTPVEGPKGLRAIEVQVFA